MKGTQNPRASAKPLCFDTMKDFKRWVTAARSSHPHPAHSYCEDCTAEYRDRMIIEGRCGHPQTKFKRVYGELVGRRPLTEVKKLRDAAILGVTVEVKNV